MADSLRLFEVTDLQNKAQMPVPSLEKGANSFRCRLEASLSQSRAVGSDDNEIESKLCSVKAFAPGQAQESSRNVVTTVLGASWASRSGGTVPTQAHGKPLPLSEDETGSLTSSLRSPLCPWHDCQERVKTFQY